jgi:hypothetical protein
VFHDRLISPEDKQLLNNRLAELVGQRLPAYQSHVLADPCLFGDYLWVGQAPACLATTCGLARPLRGGSWLRDTSAVEGAGGGE